MKEITGKTKKKSNTSPKALKINKKTLYSTEQIVNGLYPFFTNIGPFLTENIPPVSTSCMEYLTSFNDARNDSDLTTVEFETAFKFLIGNNASVIDTINSNIVLDTIDEIKDI